MKYTLKGLLIAAVVGISFLGTGAPTASAARYWHGPYHRGYYGYRGYGVGVGYPYSYGYASPYSYGYASPYSYGAYPGYYGAYPSVYASVYPGYGGYGWGRPYYRHYRHWR